MRVARHITRAAAYASSDDFRRIFDENMNSLYLLAFLLTADRGKAEQCFVSGLEDAVEGNPVFKEWAHSWARRAIIKSAVRLINPRPNGGSRRSSSPSADSDYKTLPVERHVEVSAVLGLEPFDRFVYVITVLARTRALQQIGRQVEMDSRQLPNAHAQDSGFHEGPSSVIEVMSVPPS
jgi:hypothetical protein